MFSITVEKEIRADAARAWEGLTDPDKTAQYFWGTRMEGDLRVGGQVTWRGVWEGKAFEDVGTIVQYVPRQVLQYRYWSSFSGLPNQPENQQVITYRFTPTQDGVRVSISQDNIQTQESRDHSEKNWSELLEKLRQNLEGAAAASA